MRKSLLLAAMLLMPGAAQAAALHYADSVTLEGTFDVMEGPDSGAPVPVLQLDRAINLEPDLATNVNKAEANVTAVQLAIKDPAMAKTVRANRDMHAVITGTLQHATGPQPKLSLLLNVDKMQVQ